MIQVRPFAGLGSFHNEWLNARHHFSFGQYHDPERMGLGRLRVWNDDEVAPGAGFDPHPHREMEIVTYIREGAITHRDNLGNEGRTEAGDVQVMHAGTGIVHAEYNREDDADAAVPDLDPARSARRGAGLGHAGSSPRPAASRCWQAAARRMPAAARCRCMPTPRCWPARCAPGRRRALALAPGRGVYLVAGERSGDGERGRGRHARRCGDHRRSRACHHRHGGRVNWCW